MKSNVYYQYVGNGASLASIPARDLTEAEAQLVGVARLLQSGLYKKMTEAVRAPDDKFIDRGILQTSDTSDIEK
jgi:hypothetical protein